MDHSITEDNLIREIRSRFPEIEQEYQKACSPGYEPGRYQVTSMLRKQLDKHLSSGQLTQLEDRAAEFIEQVCLSGSEEALNTIWIRLFERWIHDPAKLRVIWPILSPKTREKIRDAARRWKCPENVPR
jgi:hypothetical protein